MAALRRAEKEEEEVVEEEERVCSGGVHSLCILTDTLPLRNACCLTRKRVHGRSGSDSCVRVRPAGGVACGNMHISIKKAIRVASASLRSTQLGADLRESCMAILRLAAKRDRWRRGGG